MNRTTRHLILGGISAAGMLVAGGAGPPGGAPYRISLATSWLCLLLFAGALLIGPLYVLRTGRLLTNHPARRDLGIWCAITGLIHFGLAFDVSMNPAYIEAYVDGAAAWPGPVARRLLYFLAVVGSLVIAVFFAMLLALSSDRAIRLLGPARWKRLQRASYPAFGLTVGHSVAFQLLESRTVWLAGALAVVTLAVLLAQIAGWSRTRAARAISSPGRR